MTTRDVAQVVAELATGVVVLLPAVTELKVEREPAVDTAIDPDPSFWTPQDSTCDPTWRRTLDRILMELPSNSGGQVTAPFLTGVVLVVLTGLVAVVVIFLLLL